jgi:hypothetical protein
MSWPSFHHWQKISKKFLAFGASTTVFAVDSIAVFSNGIKKIFTVLLMTLVKFTFASSDHMKAIVTIANTIATIQPIRRSVLHNAERAGLIPYQFTMTIGIQMRLVRITAKLPIIIGKYTVIIRT